MMKEELWGPGSNHEEPAIESSHNQVVQVRSCQSEHRMFRSTFESTSRTIEGQRAKGYICAASARQA